MLLDLARQGMVPGDTLISSSDPSQPPATPDTVTASKLRQSSRNRNVNPWFADYDSGKYIYVFGASHGEGSAKSQNTNRPATCLQNSPPAGNV